MPDAVRPAFETADHQAEERPLLLTVGMRENTAERGDRQPVARHRREGQVLLDACTELARAHIVALLSGPT